MRRPSPRNLWPGSQPGQIADLSLVWRHNSPFLKKLAETNGRANYFTLSRVYMQYPVTPLWVANGVRATFLTTSRHFCHENDIN